MGKSWKTSWFVCFIFLAFETGLAMIDYCKNHTLDTPTNNENLHFSKENSDEEFGIYERFQSLHCCAHGYRSIEWFKDGMPYPWPTDVSTLIIYPESGNQTIYSQQLTSVDSGKYWCVVRNDTHFLKHEVLLQVSGPSISMGWPKTTYRPRNQRGGLKESVRFYCEAFVGTIDLPDFQSEITWERYDSNQSFIDGTRVSQETIFREEKRVIGSYLQINYVQPEDYGEYTCKVKNLGDQILELSAWLMKKDDIMEEIPIFPPRKVGFRFREFHVIAMLLVLTAVISTITILHFGSYFRFMKRKILQTPSPSDDGKKDLLIIYHVTDTDEVIKRVLPTLKNRYRYSTSLYPLQHESQIGEEELKAKANSYRGLFIWMTSSLIGGGWTCQSINNTIQSFLKVHFTVICVFEQNLPISNKEEPEGKLLRDTLSKIYYVEGMSKKDLKFLDIMKMKLSLKKNNELPAANLHELI